MAWFEHGGSRIHHEERGGGDPLLLLPGFAQSADELWAVRDALAGRYRVVSADLPGSGRSGPQPRAYTPGYYEDDARAVAALLGHLGVGPTHLVGFSDGGEVALLVAALAPGLARSVVTWGAAGALTEDQLPLLGAFDDMIDHPGGPLWGFAEHLKAVYGEDGARKTIKSFVGAARGIIARGGDISLSRAADIACPALLIAGQHDPFAAPALVSRLAARIGGAEVLAVEGAGHGVHDERPEWLARTVLDWLASR